MYMFWDKLIFPKTRGLSDGVSQMNVAAASDSKLWLNFVTWV